MLGFLKKKKKDEDAASGQTGYPNGTAEKPQSGQDTDSQTETPVKKTAKKKKSIPKLVLIILAVLIAAGASTFAVYKLWFSKPAGDGKDAERIYRQIPLPNVGLPDEMLKFSFTYFPGLYDAFVDYDKEVSLILDEIQRIEQIGQAYPEQITIAQKQIKVWDKTLQGLKKSFIKLEKPVKETYVLFRVNKEQGLTKVEELKTDLEKTAAEALASARTMTENLKLSDTVPDGLIKGTIYKLKKKFL